MNLLLLFFAIPVAVIIFSIVLQKIICCPWLVAASFFAIFLVIAFVIEEIQFLALALIYTIIAFITALIVKVICEISCGNGITFRNINAQNVNAGRVDARTVNTNTLRTNRIRQNENNEDDEENNECSCNNNNNCNNCSNCNSHNCFCCNRNHDTKNNRGYRN